MNATRNYTPAGRQAAAILAATTDRLAAFRRYTRPTTSLVKGYVDSSSARLASDQRTESDRQVAQLRHDLGYITVNYRR